MSNVTFTTNSTTDTSTCWNDPFGPDPFASQPGSNHRGQAVQDRTRQPESGNPASNTKAFRIESDALIVPPSLRKEQIDLKATGLSAFTTFPGKQGMCYYTCVAMQKAYFEAHPEIKKPTLAALPNAIQIATGEGPQGHILVDQQKPALAQAYIDRALESGCPVMVGVSNGLTSQNLDRITDHYVLIDKRGHDVQGRQYYEFKDPDGGGVGRFYVDQQNGILFKQENQPVRFARDMYSEVTQVRTYIEIK